jgi:large subunit ribosomal protein L25
MELKAATRNILGRKTKSLRQRGLLPAEMYGRGIENQHLSVPEKDFIKLYKSAGGHTVISVMTDDGKKMPAIISDVQKDALSGKILNIDLHQIRMDEKIETKVPIEFTGVPLAEKAGLVTIKVMDEIEIESLPGKIPTSFIIDLSKMERVGDSIHVSDLQVPDGVRIMVPKETVIVSVTEKTKEEVVAPPPAATTTEGVEAAAPATPEAGKNEEITK